MCLLVKFTAVLAVLLPASLLPANALTSYTLTDLGPGAANQVNDKGQVVGSDGISSFLYDGTLQRIPNPAGATFRAEGINNNGQIVGEVTYPDYTYAIGVYAGGAVQVINGSGGPAGDYINDVGQIAGTLVDAFRGFLYSGGTFTTLNGLPGDDETTARGINQAGDVLLYSTSTSGHAAIYSQGVLTMVPGSEGLDIQPTGINNSGQVVGYASNSTHPVDQAVLLSQGQATFLGVLPGTIASYAEAINDAGVIVGFNRGNDVSASVYDPGTGWVDLNSVLTNGAGWSLELANSINSEGQIVGLGLHDGVQSGYLLTPIPVPEPSTWALCGVALLGLGAWSRYHPNLFRGTAERPAQEKA